MSGIDDYCFDDKNRWRVMMWNRIAGRVKKVKAPKDAIVLYLPGPQDLDRKIALRQGFKDANLIAVDTTAANVVSLRRNGKAALRGDVVDVLANWTHRERPDVLFGDFCAGLHEATGERLISALAVAPLPDHFVLALNFQRGRDPHSNSVRESLLGDEAWSDEAIRGGAATLKRLGCDGDAKHRGRQFVYLLWVMTKAASIGDRQMVSIGQFAGYSCPADHCIAYSRPEFLSYKSGVRMDSVILQLPLHVEKQVKRTDLVHLRNDRVARQLAAVMAHRTMRQQAA